MTTLADKLLPDPLWQRVQPLLPSPPSHARGGAPRTVSDSERFFAFAVLACDRLCYNRLPCATTVRLP